MISKATPAAALTAFLLIVTGCNIFKTTTGAEPESADEHIFEGQVLLRKADYTGALGHFEAALAKDSSKSEAYYGAAKASLLQQRINMFQLLQSFQNNDGRSIPFLSEPDSLKDKIYVANRGINRYLSRLVAREKRKLTDKKITAGFFAADYALATAIEAVLSLADFNGDGRINSKDNILAGIIDFTDPSKLNPDSIMANLADLKNDTAKIEALNGLLDKSQDLLARSDEAIDLFLNTALGQKDSIASQCPAGDTACANAAGQVSGQLSSENVGDSAVAQAKQMIADAGATIVIYKVFDREDNDGDGCVDEEMLDGIDNDGDGRFDEDSRGAPEPANTRYLAHKDGADNNLDKTVDEAGEAAFHTRYEESRSPLKLPLGHLGQIYWASDTEDTRRKVILTLDSTSTPKLMDTVSTFDLCKGTVKGFRGAK